MEFLLNFVWWAVASGALWVWLRSRPSDARGFWLGCVTVLCACVLVFPAISVSDDLNNQAFTTEDGTLVKRFSVVPQKAVTGHGHVLIAGNPTPQEFSIANQREWLPRVVTHTSPVLPYFRSNISDRAPPAISALA
jgi:hypothetical protein